MTDKFESGGEVAILLLLVGGHSVSLALLTGKIGDAVLETLTIFFVLALIGYAAPFSYDTSLRRSFNLLKFSRRRSEMERGEIRAGWLQNPNLAPPGIVV